MKTTIFITATATLAMVLAASCGQNAPNEAITDEQIARWKKEIFEALPESAMPQDVQTGEPLKNVVYGAEEGPKSILVSDDPERINCLGYYDYDGNGNHTDWEMAIYVTTDRQNVVVMVQCYSGVDEANGINFEQTLNYNLKTKKLTEMEPLVDPFTIDEALQMYYISDPYIKKKAKAFFYEEPELYYRFNKNGLTAEANLNLFWLGGDEEVYDYFSENDIRPNNLKPASRTWNGQRFIDTSKKQDEATSNKNSSIKVTNAVEFLEALGSNRTIEMAPGKYNLSEWDPFLRNVDSQKPKLREGVTWEEQFDGGELTLTGIKNLTIRGSGTPGSAQIIIDPRYSFVLSFEECANIVIHGLSVGHSEGGYCAGGVFQFSLSSQITISKTGMYGCGTEGLLLSGVSDMKVTDSQIYKCTYDIMTVSGGSNIAFEQCAFTDNEQYTLINVNKTRNMSFSNCQFSNNRGGAMFNVDDTTVSVSHSTFSNNNVEDGVTNTYNVDFKSCTFK